MNDDLLNRIEQLAGPARAKTFRAAAEFILAHDCNTLVETGCYRGIIADGQSTLILALLAKKLDGSLDSFDISRDSVERAMKLLEAEGLYGFRTLVHHSDSLFGLSNHLAATTVRFAYLDSFDHDPANPGPCQRHELAEIGAIYAKMLPPCAILLDDNIPETGGKTLLGAQFLLDRGWTLAAEAYQKLFTKME